MNTVQAKERTPSEFFNAGAIDLIKNQINLSSGEVTKEEIDSYLYHCAAVELNPLKRQIYALPFMKDGKRQLIPMVSIDGLRAIAHRTGECNGIKTKVIYKNGRIHSAKCQVIRRAGKFVSEVLFKEYTTNQNLWSYKPETMIRKVAEAHALRMAFPEMLAGLYTDGEFDQSKSEEINNHKTEIHPKVKGYSAGCIEPTPDWKTISALSKTVNERAKIKGIDISNGFAIGLVKRIRENFELKQNYDQTLEDVNELELRVNAHEEHKKILEPPKEPKKAGRPPKVKKESITLDSVTNHAQDVCKMEPDMFLDRYKHELASFNEAKKEGDSTLSDESLNAIMDDLKMWSMEVSSG